MQSRCPCQHSFISETVGGFCPNWHRYINGWAEIVDKKSGDLALISKVTRALLNDKFRPKNSGV